MGISFERKMKIAIAIMNMFNTIKPKQGVIGGNL